MSIFFEDIYKFDYDIERKKFIDNLNFLKSMSVEEITLYKKWKQSQEYRNRYDSSILTKTNIWKPTDINNKNLTIKEIENLKPKIIIASNEFELDEWLNIRLFVSSFSFQMNPGRLIKYLIIDENTNKYLGISSLGSDVTSISTRDEHIGWDKKNKFEEGKLNSTAIGTTIVPTQPFGYNFLGGKLIASLLCIKKIREDWKNFYNSVLVGITTTSLYGQGSMYNGIPFWKSLGETRGKMFIIPDDEYYDVWHQWLKENASDEYNKIVNNESINGPVTGIKQKILILIMKKLNIKYADYTHGYKRGVYFAPLYENYKEFLTSKINETELVLNKKLEGDLNSILNWWKPKAINRYLKLYNENRIDNTVLYYNKVAFMSWEETKNSFLKNVGR